MDFLGKDFSERHCYECGNTFDCVKNLEFHCQRTLHNPHSFQLSEIIKYHIINDMERKWLINREKTND